MKKKRLWLLVALTVLVVVCAMLILSRVNEARSNAVPTAPTDLILPPDIRTTAAPTQKTYDDLPDVDISSWEYLIASQAHNISDYVPDVSKISGSQSTFDSRASMRSTPCSRRRAAPGGALISIAPTART